MEIDSENTGLAHEGKGAANTPRWVKVFGIVTIVLVLLFIILHLTGNSLGSHGPSTEHEAKE